MSSLPARRQRHGLPKGALALTNPQSPIPNPGRATRANGFTLLEVLAAIALLGIAFAILMQVAGGAIGLTSQAADASAAAMWARSKLDSAYAVEPLQPGHSAGRFDRKFRWQLDVTPWHAPAADDPTPLQLYQLDLQVSWGAAAHPHTANFRTLRLLSADRSTNPMATKP
ncbi:MAG TPA: prepilin-type N-terminal cleavage/methylation domain-containing protein [Rhodanobacter sp.]|nr:prepilin-type N-terminal cleavage/methylation domain-containing protein [Rhodanobacter sp.]